MKLGSNEDLRFEVDDRLPGPLVFGLALQSAALCINRVVLLPTIVFRAGGAEEFLSWAVFTAVMASGLSTILQAVRVGRIGAGYLVLHGSAASSIAISAEALVQGGPAMLASLAVVLGVAQAAFSARLSLLHPVFTPVVTGTVIMLVPVTVMPILFRMLNESPSGAPPLAGPLSAAVTIAAILGIALKGTGAVRLWAPVAGIVSGSEVGGFFGIYNTATVADAAWIGTPAARTGP